MDEQEKTVEQVPEETPEERKKALFRRWTGLILGTLVLIASALLAAEAMKRVITVKTVYDEVIQIDVNDLYGSWRYAELSHQWAGSSATYDAAQEAMVGTVFGITEEAFMADGGVSWSVKRPQYILHALDAPTGAFDDVKAWLGDAVLGYYAVLSEGGTVQPYRIYFSQNQYWVTSFKDDNTAGSVILYDIYRIEKAN